MNVVRTFAVSGLALIVCAAVAGQAAPTPSTPSLSSPSPGQPSLSLPILSLNDQLIAAATNGDAAGVQQLLQKGANIEAKDNLGWTPLIWAAYQGHTEVVNLLLEKGANLEAKGNKGQTALQSLTAESGGFAPAITNLVIAGKPLVDEIAARWDLWQGGIPTR